MVVSELVIISIAAFIFGAILGFPLVAISMVLTKSFLLDKLIVPLNFIFNYIGVIATVVGIIAVPILAALPALFRSRKEKVAEAIQAVA